MEETPGVIETYVNRIKESCRKSVPGKEVNACTAFMEEPILINTFANSSVLVPPGGYCMRLRVECNDAHANPEALKTLHGDVNGLMLELLRRMGSDQKLKYRKIYDLSGSGQKKVSIANIPFDAAVKPSVTYTPYAGEDGYFCEQGDHKILFYLFTPDKKVVEEIGKQFKGHGITVFDGLQSGRDVRRL